MIKKTLVIGASEQTDRYSNQAVKLLRRYGHEVKALGAQEGRIEDTKIEAVPPQDEDFDTVTMYVNPARQSSMADYVLSLHPKRIIFNPGAENPALAKKAEDQGIEVLEACTLVMLRTNQY